MKYANALPFGDQWDSEGISLLKPFVEGNLFLSQLFSAHNEHRIFFKRIFDIAVYSLNSGYWDNRISAIANSGVYAAVIALLGAATVQIEDKWIRRTVLAFVVLLPVTTVNFENTLWGFQSPFYFLTLFSIIIIKRASKYDLSAHDAAIILLLSIFSLGTLASGFLVAPIAAMMVRASPAKKHGAGYLRIALAACLCGIAAIGYSIVPKFANQGALQAQSLLEIFNGATLIMAWPVPQIPIAWLPSLVWVSFAVWHRRKPAAIDMFFLGLLAWTFLQILAIAHGRGHDLSIIASRYTDALMPGILSNLYFCCRLFADAGEIRKPISRATVRILASIIVAILCAYGYTASTNSINLADSRRLFCEASFTTTQSFLRGIPVNADQLALPYPNETRLSNFLGDSTIRQLLRIDQNGLPAPCDMKRIGVLSRAFCAVERIFAKPAFAEFLPVESFSNDGGLPSCNLDLPIRTSPAPTIFKDLPVRLMGWIGSDSGEPHASPGQHNILLVGENAEYVITGPAIRRPDVAKVYGAAHYEWSGFDITASLAGVDAGEYEIIIKDWDTKRCRTGTSVRIP